MVIITSHSHFVHVEFVRILVFQTSDRMIFGIDCVFLEQGCTWCRDDQGAGVWISGRSRSQHSGLCKSQSNILRGLLKFLQ